MAATEPQMTEPPALEMANRTTNDIFLMSVLNNVDRYFALLQNPDTAEKIGLRDDYIRNLIQLIGDEKTRIKVSEKFDDDLSAITKNNAYTEDEKKFEKKRLLAASLGNVSGYIHQFIINSETNVVAKLGQDITEEDVDEFLHS